MATELTTNGPALDAVNQLRLLMVGQQMKTDDIAYGTARTMASREGKKLERVYNVTRDLTHVYITRVV